MRGAKFIFKRILDRFVISRFISILIFEFVTNFGFVKKLVSTYEMQQCLLDTSQ